MSNDEIPFRKAGTVAGLAYNTIKRMRYERTLPFPVHKRTLPGRTKPMLFCMASEIEAWKRGATTKD
jgi:hypothetical protein